MSDGRARACFFLGPTMPAASFREACQSLDAEVSLLPPVQQGDLLRLGEELPDVIGIIDGLFFKVPSVSHKEILWALERGARVLGASSLGALRAAELDVFGMEGVGRIYRMYKDGEIDGDDEVAVTHTDEAGGYRLLTEPLVNIRYNLLHARARGVISPRTAGALIEHAKGLPFTERTYAALLSFARSEGAPADELNALRAFLRNGATDLKREDALALARAVGEGLGEPGRRAPRPSVRVHRTIFFYLLQREYTGHSAGGEHVPDVQVLAFYKLLSGSFPRFLGRMSLRWLALEEAHHRGIKPPSGEELLAAFPPWRAMQSEAERRAWLEAHFLSESELVTTLRERNMESQVVALYAASRQAGGRAAAYRRVVAEVSARLILRDGERTRPMLIRPGVPDEEMLLREIKLRGRFRAALRRAQRVLRSNTEISDSLPGVAEALAVGRLERWFAERSGVAPEHVERALLDRGFMSLHEFLAVARLAYVDEHFGVEPMSPAPGV
nr:hypothetical protein [uncultured bacterium]